MSATPQTFDRKRPINREDLDYVRNARAVIKGDRVVGANLLLFAIVVLVVSFVVWASQAKIDEVTKGEGKVIPSSSIQTVQNLEGGIVAELFVREGSRVSKDEVLLRIDDTLSVSTYREHLATSQALQARLDRYQAEATMSEHIDFTEDLEEKRPDLVQRESELFQKRKSDLEKQRTLLEKSLSLAGEELTMTVPLVQKGVVSRVEQLRLERDVASLEAELQDLVAVHQREALEKYNETKAELESLQEVIQGREDRVKRTLVRSPVEGTVNELYMNTIGGVVQPGEPIADIVPHNDTLLIEAKIRPSDIAFLRPGQKATLKFSAYDFALYGGLEGTVEQISADTIQDDVDKQHYYIIKVRNNEGRLLKDGEELPIIPGMVVEVDVLTGRRTVLQYLMKPFHRMRYNSLRER